MPNGEVWRELQRLGEVAERHDKDIYRGNGLPGLTTRMAQVEKAVASITYYFRVIIVLLLGLLIHAFWDLVTKH